MAESSFRTAELQRLQERMRSGDAAAREELLRHVGGRLERLARKMLGDFPGVKRWAQTDDVLQNALMRLLRALQDVRADSVRAFFGLATLQIRRELLDLARHFQGPQGLGAHHASDSGAGGAALERHARPDDSFEPASLAEWGEFHEQIGRLPDEEREVVGLLYYQGLAQAEAAALLGVTVRTVQRRWQAALLRLRDSLAAE